jgi:hypothetical protein
MPALPESLTQWLSDSAEPTTALLTYFTGQQALHVIYSPSCLSVLAEDFREGLVNAAEFRMSDGSLVTVRRKR